MKPRRQGIDKARAAYRARRGQLERDVKSKARLYHRMVAEYSPESARALAAANDGMALLRTLTILDALEEQTR